MKSRKKCDVFLRLRSSGSRRFVSIWISISAGNDRREIVEGIEIVICLPTESAQVCSEVDGMVNVDGSTNLRT